MLPSAVMANGYNTDMICASLAVGYESYCAQCARDGVDATKPKPTQAEMLAMIERVKHDKSKTQNQ